MPFIDIKIDDSDFRRGITDLTRRGADLSPAMKNISELMVNSVQRNFDAQGRPAKWEDDAPLNVPRVRGDELKASRGDDTR